MNTHYNNNRQKSRLTSGIDKTGVLAKLQKALIPPHPSMDIILPAVARIGKDGVDHINIDTAALTKLGSGLHHRTGIQFDHPLFGPFNSVEGFWNWYFTEERDDRLRTLSPASMMPFMQSNFFRKTYPSDLRFRIMEATWVKIMSVPALTHDMRTSTLPFDIYRPSNDDLGSNRAGSPVRIRPPFANWMVPALEEIRKALKEHRQPDLFGLLSTADDRANITTLATPTPKPKKPKAKKPQADKPMAVTTEQDENAVPANLVDPHAQGEKPLKIKGVSDVDVGSMAGVDREQATEYGNPAVVYHPTAEIRPESEYLDTPGEQMLNVTGIANPTDTLEEGGKQVQELVQEQLKAEPTPFTETAARIDADDGTSNQPQADDERFTLKA